MNKAEYNIVVRNQQWNSHTKKYSYDNFSYEAGWECFQIKDKRMDGSGHVIAVYPFHNWHLTLEKK